MSEGDLVRNIISALNIVGVKAWRCQSGMVKVKRAFMHLAPKGTPDVIGYVMRGPSAGRFVAVEAKLKGNKPAPEQLQWIADARVSGVLAGVAYSVDDALKIAKG